MTRFRPIGPRGRQPHRVVHVDVVRNSRRGQTMRARAKSGKSRPETSSAGSRTQQGLPQRRREAPRRRDRRAQAREQMRGVVPAPWLTGLPTRRRAVVTSAVSNRGGQGPPGAPTRRADVRGSARGVPQRRRGEQIPADEAASVAHEHSRRWEVMNEKTEGRSRCGPATIRCLISGRALTPSATQRSTIPAARPSMLSIRLTAFMRPTTQRTSRDRRAARDR